MKLLIPFLSAGLIAATAAGCGQASAPPGDKAGPETLPIDETENRPMPGQESGMMENDSGHATGTIILIGPDGGSVTIDHGPFDGIDMGAMTMGFDLMGDADLTGFSEGEEVAFRVKRGRDGSYRVMEICSTAMNGDGCLGPTTGHPASTPD